MASSLIAPNFTTTVLRAVLLTTVGEVSYAGQSVLHHPHRRCWPSSGKRGGLLVIRYAYPAAWESMTVR